MIFLLSLQLALQNALRYFPCHLHEVLAPEFARELRNYGHIYMYRFRPDIEMRWAINLLHHYAVRFVQGAVEQFRESLQYHICVSLFGPDIPWRPGGASPHGIPTKLFLQWRRNERYGVSNHRRHDYLLSRLFRRRSKKTSNSASLAFVRGIHRWPVDSLHKGSVAREMFPFDDVIMWRIDVLYFAIVGVNLTNIFQAYLTGIDCTSVNDRTQPCNEYHDDVTK